MSNFCGPKSGCKTIRCICKSRNIKCKEGCNTCQCNPDSCTNFNDSSSDEDTPKYSKIGCGCSKDNCNTKRCSCFKNSIKCSHNCSCNDCENTGKSILKPDNNETNRCKCLSGCSTNHCICKKNKNFCYDCNCKNCENQHNRVDLDLEINEIASQLTKDLRLGSVSTKRDDIFEFRKNLDIYTLKKKNEVLNPQVDHVIEDQMVGHAAARVFRSLSGVAPYLDGLKKALNIKSFENYNVTFGEINGSKGSIIKGYLNDGLNKGFPLRAMIKPETHFGKNMERIFKAMDDTHSIVEEYISEAKCSDNNLSGSKFRQISNELNSIVDEMQLNVDEDRKLRSNKKY